MEIRKNVPVNTITRDISKLCAKTGNVYETTMIIAQRANQISAELKNELRQKLEEFSSLADTLEETFANREQIEISRYYEKLPKPTLLAVNEFEEGLITYKKIEG